MSYYNEGIQDSLLYVELDDVIVDYNLNQLEMANIARDEILKDTIACFAEIVPYEIVITIFNEISYIWNELFINKLLDVLNTGVYGNNLTVNEKTLIKSYVDFKYNNTVESSALLVSLDEHLGAL